MIFTVPNLIFVILIAILTGYLTFLTTKGNLTDNRHENYWRKLTTRGKFVFFNLFGILLLLILQEYNNQNSSINKDFIISQERDSRDSLITTGIKEGINHSNNQFYENIANAFANQGLELDTLNNTIIKIKDSLETRTVYYNQPEPVLFIKQNGIYIKESTNLSKHYAIEFVSQDAGSTNFQIECYILSEHLDKTNHLSRMNFFTKKMRLPKNSVWKSGYRSINSKECSLIYFYLKGQYSTLDNKKTIKIQDIYQFDCKENKVSKLIRNQNQIIEKINSIPLDYTNDWYSDNN